MSRETRVPYNVLLELIKLEYYKGTLNKEPLLKIRPFKLQHFTITIITPEHT